MGAEMTGVEMRRYRHDKGKEHIVVALATLTYRNRELC
jgi:hypothetical protein